MVGKALSKSRIGQGPYLVDLDISVVSHFKHVSIKFAVSVSVYDNPKFPWLNEILLLMGRQNHVGWYMYPIEHVCKDRGKYAYHIYEVFTLYFCVVRHNHSLEDTRCLLNLG